MPAVPLHSPTLASALSRHWPKLFEAVLLALLLVQLARFAWPFFTPPKAPTIASLPAQIPNLAGHDPFFGGVTSNAAASDNLDGWRVFGLRTGNGDSAAILGKDKDRQGAYRIGDTLMPGLKLAAIAEDHVLLESGGVQRKLEFPAGATALVGHTVAAALPSSPAPAAPVTLNANEVNPSQLLSEAGLQAVTENGLVAGYTLLPRGNNALLQAAGLKPGDVLLQINGQTLSAESLQQMSEQLKTNPRATFTVHRDGETRTLTLGNGTP